MIVYRHSPSSSDANFIRFLEDVKKLINRGDYVIMKDFNTDFIVDK